MGLADKWMPVFVPTSKSSGTDGIAPLDDLSDDDFDGAGMKEVMAANVIHSVESNLFSLQAELRLVGLLQLVF